MTAPASGAAPPQAGPEEAGAPALPVRAIERPADAALFRRLLAEIRALHHDCIMARRHKQTSVLAVNLQVFCHRAAANFHDLARLGVTLPDGIFRHYRTEPRMLERLKVPPKYRIRPYNLSRDLLRYACLVPEFLDPAAPRQEVLELSPGACAAQELLVPLGHRLHLAEFETGPGSRYGALHDELGIAPRHFDGRIRPFDLPDAMADIVLCFQAFDFYSKSADDYPALLAQMQRMARRKCVVVLNSHRPRLDPPEAIAAIKARFAGMAGIRWSLCPDTLLLALIWDRPPG